MTEEEDLELLRRVREGDAEAFHAIFQRHAPAVRRFAGSVLGSAADADEATQETFVRAHARLSRLRDGTRLRAWLLGIARIVALDELSERKREPLADEDAADEVLLETPEDAALSTEAEFVLHHVLEALSPERRAAVLLRIDHALGYPEIAEAMGWTLQKVKNEIHRARLKMRATVLDYLKGKPWRST